MPARAPFLLPLLLLWLPLAWLAAASGDSGARAQAPAGCDVQAERVAAPARLILGETTRVTLTLSGACDELGLPMNAVLAYDTSLAMGGPRIGYMKDSVAAFVDAIDLGRSRVGLASFHGRTEVLSELTDDRAALVAAAESFFPRPGSDQVMALRAMHDILERGRAEGGDERLEVAILLAGSTHEGEPDAVIEAATALKDEDILLIVIAMTGEADFPTLEAVATSSEHFHVETSGILFPALLADIARDVSRVRLTGAEVRDTPDESMELVWGSDIPPARPVGDDLLWRYDVWPSDGITITYALEPQTIGRHPISQAAEAELRFDRGAAARVDIPVPEIEVLPVPSATGPPTVTPTPSPTPTATPPLRPAYLPYALRDHCRPRRAGADFALLVDTSSSMRSTQGRERPLLAEAVWAGAEFIDALDLPTDRMSVLSFDAEARTRLGLSANKAALKVALAGLFGGARVGSRLDHGIALGARVLTGEVDGGYPGPVPPRYQDPERERVLVVLTDGRAAPREALAAARAARDRGVTLYAIGLGPDVDASLLAQIAGDPSRYFESPSGEDLGAIYRGIARGGCP